MAADAPGCDGGTDDGTLSITDTDVLAG